MLDSEHHTSYFWNNDTLEVPSALQWHWHHCGRQEHIDVILPSSMHQHMRTCMSMSHHRCKQLHSIASTGQSHWAPPHSCRTRGAVCAAAGTTQLLPCGSFVNPSMVSICKHHPPHEECTPDMKKFKGFTYVSPDKAPVPQFNVSPKMLACHGRLVGTHCSSHTFKYCEFPAL